MNDKKVLIGQLNDIFVSGDKAASCMMATLKVAKASKLRQL